MKKPVLFLSIAMCCVANILLAQIPNPGFESWANMGTYSNPDGWGTMNNTTNALGVYTATKGTPGSPGTSYLKLTSQTFSSGVVNGIAVSGKLDSITQQPISGFAYNQRAQKFTGKWQHMLSGTSQGSISVKLTRWNTASSSRETVATANTTLSGMAMSWANFTINFTYLTGNDPDTCIIVLKASGPSPTAGDYLWVDNLAFTGTVLGINNQNNFINNLTVYPNPSTSAISIDLNLKTSGETTVELFDLTGKTVLSKNISLPQGESTQMLDVAALAKGIYFVRIVSKNETETRKIIIE